LLALSSRSVFCVRLRSFHFPLWTSSKRN